MGNTITKPIRAKHQRRYKKLYPKHDIESVERFLELDSFQRLPGEPLSDCVARLKKLIEATEEYIDPEQRQKREDYLVKSSIIQFISPDHAIMLDRMKARKKGKRPQKLEPDTLLKEAMILEARRRIC